MYLYSEQYMKCSFLREQNENFLGWICPLLKQSYQPIDQYIYYDTDIVEEIFFLTVGNAGFVLPLKENIVYIELEVGDMFGQLDFVMTAIQNHTDVECVIDSLQ